MGGPSCPASGAGAEGAGSGAPLRRANRLTSRWRFLPPHLGQVGVRSGRTRLLRKLKIRRHLGHANS